MFCLRIGPIRGCKKMFWIVRGENGAVTYGHYIDDKLNDLNDHHGNLSIHKISNKPNNPECEWLGGQPCECDGRTVNKMTDDSEIFQLLERDYITYLD